MALYNVSCNLSSRPLQNKLHETLHSVTYLATAENICEISCRNRCEKKNAVLLFATFSFVAQSHELLLNACGMFRATCLAMVCETSCTKKVAQCDNAFSYWDSMQQHVARTKVATKATVFNFRK